VKLKSPYKNKNSALEVVALKCSTRENKIMKLVLGVVTLVFLISCSGGLNSNKKNPIFEKWAIVAEDSKGHSPAAEQKKISISDLTAKEAAAAAKAAERTNKLPSKKINLTMRQAELKAVLRAMAKSVDLNVMLKNDLKGEISVDFRGVPWDQAFVGLLRTHGLSYVWEGDILLVKTADDIEQDLKQKVQLRDIQWVEPLLQPVVISVDYADPKKLMEMLQDFLTKDKDGKPRGSVKVDEHSNSLVISAMREDLAKMLPIIEKIDKPTPQILIKANIVETTKTVARDLGIKWGGYHGGTVVGSENHIVTGGSGVPVGGIGGKGFGVNFPAGTAAAAALDAAGPLGTLGLMFGKIGGNLLEVELQALQKDSLLNILSSPSITTLDNQKASTQNGEKVPYVTTEISGGIATRTTKFEDVVMLLEITPHVIDGKNLKMTILVKKDEVDPVRKVEGNPYIIRKETKTTLIVKDGETIVISGLTKQRLGDGDAGLPWLKDIPLLGYLVKADNKSEAMEEVLIFITPHILPVEKNQDKIVPTDNEEKQKIETEPDQNKSDMPERKKSVDSTQ
jgi:type IV pilus assembly protein PilQ